MQTSAPNQWLWTLVGVGCSRLSALCLFNSSSTLRKPALFLYKHISGQVCARCFTTAFYSQKWNCIKLWTQTASIRKTSETANWSAHLAGNATRICLFIVHCLFLTCSGNYLIKLYVTVVTWVLTVDTDKRTGNKKHLNPSKRPDFDFLTIFTCIFYSTFLKAGLCCFTQLSLSLNYMK